MAVKKFDADYSIVAYSGFAILLAVSFDGERTPNTVLPPLYDKLGITAIDPMFTLVPSVFDDGSYELQSTSWNLKDFVPDLIVINFGTNDSFYFYTIDQSKVAAEIEVFVQKYEDFLAQLRSIYPKTEILCTYGTMGQYIVGDIDRAVNNYTSKAVVINVSTPIGSMNKMLRKMVWELILIQMLNPSLTLHMNLLKKLKDFINGNQVKKSILIN